MSMLGELVLKTALKVKNARNVLSRTSPTGWEDYIRWQFETSRALFDRYPNFDVVGKTVLEIGCGTGGRAAYLASIGAKRVVAIDINADEISVARNQLPVLFPDLVDRVQYLVNSDPEVRDIGQFDIVVLVDCLEHVVSPPEIVRLAYDHTLDGGKCYISSIGWYHKDGSHTGLLPFVNVVFSDETILNVTRWSVTRPGYAPTRFDSDPPIDRWRGIYDLRQRPGEYLNKITLREMKRLITNSVYPRASMHVLGFRPTNPIAKLVNPLRHLPIVQEIAHSYVVLELER